MLQTENSIGKRYYKNELQPYVYIFIYIYISIYSLVGYNLVKPAPKIASYAENRLLKIADIVTP